MTVLKNILQYHPRLARGSNSASARLLSHMTHGHAFGCPRKAGMAAVVYVFCFLLLATTPARAEVSPQGALMVANVAGECEMLYSMIEFQKQSNIQGGEEYVAKFWSAEAAKMKLTVEQLSDRCKKSTAAYDKVWDSLVPAEGKPANGNE